MIHRAILGSVERMMAILCEHFGGKWPLWLSPRQVVVVPVDPKFAPYAESVARKFHEAGFVAEAELSSKRLNKKIRESQLAQWNFILVVGSEEEDAGTVNIRTRANERIGIKSIPDAVVLFKEKAEAYE